MSAEAGEPGFVDFGGLPHSAAVREALDRLDIKYISWSTSHQGYTLARRLRFWSSSPLTFISTSGFVAYCSTEKTTSSHHTSALERLLGVFTGVQEALDFAALNLPHQNISLSV